MFEIAGHVIGEGHPCFVIAEAGVNHNGNLELAHRLIEAAHDAGADAVKFQTFRAEDIVTAAAPKAEYQRRTTDSAESQLEMLKLLELDAEAHWELIRHCEQLRVLFLSAPFDEASADMLELMGLPGFKVPSGEITNLPFLAYLAQKARPLIVSTGMSTLGEIETAVAAIHASGTAGLSLLHCVSNYPADPATANLRAMRTMAEVFDLPVGFSDHTLGIEVALAAVALGACIIEKHLTLDRTLPGPDHKASLEPAQFTALVNGIRKVEVALGHGRKEPVPGEAETAAVARKSLTAACDLPAGTVLAESMIAIKRPGTGLSPATKAALVGRRTRTDIAAGSALTWDMLA